MELSEKRLNRVCWFHSHLKLLSIRLRMFAYAMGDVENIMPEEAQRIFILWVAVYSPTWKEPKTATEIWQDYGKDLIDRGNACKALDSLVGGLIIRVLYESSLDQPSWGRKAKRKSSPGRLTRYTYQSTVNIKADKEDLKRRFFRQMEKAFIEDLPFLKRTGVVEEFSQALTDFLVCFVPMLLDFWEGLARVFPDSVFAKVVEKEKFRLGTKKWEKGKMAARNLSEKDLREMREAFLVRIRKLL